MGRYRFALAAEEDDAELRSILAATPMPGMISIAFQREPSYFEGTEVEGRFRQVIAARDQTIGRIVGIGARSIGDRHVNGRPVPVGYLSTLRVLPEHRGGGLIARGYAFLRHLHEDGRTALYLTTIAEDNRQAIEILTSGRAGLPAYHPLGRYCTAALPLCRPARRRKPSGVEIRPARRSDVPAIVDFLTATGAARQFFPCYAAADFFAGRGALRGLRPEDMLLATHGDRLVGTLAGWDQTGFRQLIVHSYGMPLRALRPLYNGWARLRGRPLLPQPGTSLRCLTAALPVAWKDDPAIMAALLDSLLSRQSGRGWDYLLVGMHESDPLLPALREFPARRYTTQVFLACWNDGEPLRASLDGRPLYLELGSL